jgi:hypothetical protein
MIIRLPLERLLQGAKLIKEVIALREIQRG